MMTKKTLSILVFSLLYLTSILQAQTTNTVRANKVEVREHIKLAGRTVKGISRTGTNAAASADSLMTQKAVKEAITAKQKTDKTILITSGENYVVDFELISPADSFLNVYFVCKGGADTAQVMFLGPPDPYEDWKGVTFHVKADSGKVALKFGSYYGVNMQNLYWLEPGQRAEVRALYDAVGDAELWDVAILWDKVLPSKTGIYSGSDSLSQTDTYAAMAADGTQTLAFGNWPGFPDRDYDYATEYGLYVSPNNEVTLAGKRTQLTFYDGFISLATEDERNTVFLDADQHQVIFIGGRNTQSMRIDSFGIEVGNSGGFIDSYRLIPSTRTTRPSETLGAISNLIWTGSSNDAIPSFLRSQHGVATGTTDGSGDLIVTFPAAMPDITYAMQITVEGTTSYTVSVHTKATGTCKVRFFNPATGAAVTATSVTVSYEAKDY